MHRTSIDDRIAANVRAAMARRRISQLELAKRIFASNTRMSNRLLGRVSFTISELADIATALDVPLSSLTEMSEVSA